MGRFAFGLAGALMLSAAAVLAQSVLTQAVRTSESMEPALVHPEQDAAAQAKLDALFATTGKRPNIVWFVVDDMGYGDPGAFGGGAAIGAATPNMDRLAREGLKLTSTYSQATCTPTRSAILTGRLPVRTGLTRPILAGDKITKNPWADEISLPKLLGEAGYKTVLSGKWHVGEAEGMRPQDVGFDEFYGFYEAEKEISQGVDKRRYPDLVLNPERLEMLRRTGSSNALVHGFKGGQTTDVEAIDSIEKMAEGDRLLKEFTRRQDQGTRRRRTSPSSSSTAFMKVHADNFAARPSRARAPASIPTRTTSSRWTPISARSSRRWTRRACSTTPSSSSPPTTARSSIAGRTAATRRSAAPRARPGKAACACPASPTGRA